MNINKKLLPIKGHFFLFNAGTGPLVPYLSSYARQLGFTSATVGLIYTVLPIFGLIAKPLFGVIADRYKIQKTLFILFQIVTICSLSAIYFVPEDTPTAAVDLDCGSSASTIRSCYKDASLIDYCKVITLGEDNSTAVCHMNCDMVSYAMWQTVCEHWHLPQFCYNDVKTIKYEVNISQINEIEDCVDLSPGTVTLDGFTYQPACVEDGYGYLNHSGPCSLDCKDMSLSVLINNSKVNMSCEEGMLNFRLCSYNVDAMLNVTREIEPIGECEVTCDVDSPMMVADMCETWNADDSKLCQAQISLRLPLELSFDASFKVHKTITDHNCLYMEVEHIQVSDGSIHYPYCVYKHGSEPIPHAFHSFCTIDCDNHIVNELLRSSSESRRTRNPFTKTYWMFFVLMIISWIGQAVVVTFADAICFNVLGTKVASYGKQRLWGSVGWGIFSLLTGTLIDLFSGGPSKDYTVAFVLMFIFMFGDVIVSCYTRVDVTKMSVNILADVGALLLSPTMCAFLLWTIAVGLCTGLLWQFLFWHIEDIAGQICDNSDYVKTLQGLVSAIQTFGGEIPFLMLSGYILKKIGHVNTMTLVLFAFGCRFVLYSFLTNPWWILPIEMLQGITFGMFYPTMTSYANVVSPSGTETTVQGIVGAIFEGIGSSFGSLIGGLLYENYGGWQTFRWFGYGAFVACAIHVVFHYFFISKQLHGRMTQGFTNAVRYSEGTDGASVHILADIAEEQPGLAVVQ